MSTCERCGKEFGCAMADKLEAPCWCTALPPAVPLPGGAGSCWCQDCLAAHIQAAAKRSPVSN